MKNDIRPRAKRALVFAVAFALLAFHGPSLSQVSISTEAAANPASVAGSQNTVTTSQITSGNDNVLSVVVSADPLSASTGVYTAVLGQITTPSTAAAITSPGHTIGVFGYNIVNKTQGLAIGTEGKLKVGLTGVTLTDGASMHCGLEDVVSGATITNYSCVNAQITANSGTISNAKAFNFSVVASTAAIGNLFAFNAADVTVAQATNYGAFRSQVTANTGHFGLYFDGSAQNAISGNTYIGALADNGSSAKLQVTGSATVSGKVVNGGAAPAIGACGTSPSVVGRDQAFFVTVGTGGVATSCAVTFNVNYTTNPPVCIAQNNTDRVSYNMVTTVSTATWTAAAAFTAGSKFHVICSAWL